MRFRYVLFASIMLCFAAPVLAQLDCPTLVEGGISTLAANCGNLEANTVCYGSDSVESSFAADALPTTFDSPGDRAFLSQFLSIHTVPANLEKQLWGIVALRANVPLDSSDTEATILLMGDTTLRYTANVDDARVFQFTSALTSPACDETPSTLAIQGAANAQLSLNDASIRFAADSIIALQQVSANSLTLIVESGQIEVSDDGGDPDQVAQAGQTLAAITENTGNIILWSAAREISDEESQTAGIVVEALLRMAEAPAPVEPEPIATEEVVTVEQPVATQAPILTEVPVEVPTEEPILPCGPDVIHVVQRGENIYRISLRYGTTVDAIAAANNLANPRLIHSGLQLRIPCPNSFVSAPPSAPPALPPASIPACSGGSTTYVVQTGDSLFGIALRFGTTVEAIAAANGITDINAISIGQTLVIPCGSVPAIVDCTPFITAGLPCP